MALKANGIVIPLETKVLIVDDSVMGFFRRRGDGDASPGAVSYIVTAIRVRVIIPSRNAAATH